MIGIIVPNVQEDTIIGVVMGVSVHSISTVRLIQPIVQSVVVLVVQHAMIQVEAYVVSLVVWLDRISVYMTILIRRIPTTEFSTYACFY